MELVLVNFVRLLATVVWLLLIARVLLSWTNPTGGGGLTSIGGAFAAGIVLGVAEAWIAYETPVIGTVEVVLALFIIVLLLIRPQGLVRSSY